VASYADFSSEELIRACAGSKDDPAWAEFIRRFQPVIAAAVLRVSRLWGEQPHSLLDDLIQETYLKLCENDRQLLRNFAHRHKDSIYGFLKVLAANVVHDHFKHVQALKRGAAQTDPLLEPIQIDSRTTGTDSFEIVSQRLQLEQVEKILRQAAAGKDQERNCIIFWLRHRLGLTAGEIASISSFRLTTEGVESVLMRLAIRISDHMISSTPHREVKVLRRQNRSNR